MKTPYIENGNGSRFVTKAMPCFECEACKSEDCLECKWCHDKKKNGGPGRLNKRCIKRRCTKPKIVEMIEHTTNRPVKMMRLEEGGKSEVYYTTTPVRTTYLQAGGLVKAMPCRYVTFVELMSLYLFNFQELFGVLDGRLWHLPVLPRQEEVWGSWQDEQAMPREAVSHAQRVWSSKHCATRLCSQNARVCFQQVPGGWGETEES